MFLTFITYIPVLMFVYMVVKMTRDQDLSHGYLKSPKSVNEPVSFGLETEFKFWTLTL